MQGNVIRSVWLKYTASMPSGLPGDPIGPGKPERPRFPGGPGCAAPGEPTGPGGPRCPVGPTGPIGPGEPGDPARPGAPVPPVRPGGPFGPKTVAKSHCAYLNTQPYDNLNFPNRENVTNSQPMFRSITNRMQYIPLTNKGKE